MAELTESAYESKFNDLVTGLLKDNTNKEIVPLRHRTQVTDTKDSFLNIKTRYGSYIRQIEAFGTNTYTATTTLSPSTALSTGAVYLIFFENSSTAAASVTLNGFTRKLYINPSTQAGNGDLTAEIPYLFVVDETLDAGNGGLLMVTGGATGGSGVTDGDKGDIVISSSGTVYTWNAYVEEIVSTASGTITLPFDSKVIGFFSGSATFATNKTVVFGDDERATQFDFIFETTAEDVTLDFGEDTRSSHPDFVDGVFTAVDVGLRKVHGTRYGPDGLWILDFKGVYSVGDTPPTPADQWILGTGIWNDSEFWDDSAFWKDNP